MPASPLKRTSNNRDFAGEKTAGVCAGEVTSNLCETIGHVGAVEWRVLGDYGRGKMVKTWWTKGGGDKVRRQGPITGQPATPQCHIRRACLLQRPRPAFFLSRPESRHGLEHNSGQ